MFYWQRYCDVEITTSNLHYLQTHKTSNSQHCANFASTLDSVFTIRNIMDVVRATLIRRCIRSVKFTMNSGCWYYDVVPVLCHLCEEREMLSNHGHMVTFKLVWYAGSILRHQSQNIASFSYCSSSQSCFWKVQRH